MGVRHQPRLPETVVDVIHECLADRRDLGQEIAPTVGTQFE
jgi:hypothetical protein